ncbi:MAG: hypothetical protein ABI613_02195 [Gemmatimonadota bacterium]
MRLISRTHILVTAACVLGSATPVRAQQSPGQTMADRMLARSAIRVRQRPELSGRVNRSFNRDSLWVHTLRGLRRSDDSTLTGWFKGFAVLLEGVNAEGCNRLAGGRPDPRRVTAFVATADSAALEQWLQLWESAAVASYIGAKRPPVPDEAMLSILFGMMADLARETPDSVPASDQECWRLRSFFRHAEQLSPEDQVVVYRSIGEQMTSKKSSSSTP